MNTITMPKLGFDMAEGLLVRWVRQVGEPIQKGDVLAEIETDKATVEVESSASGIVLKHIVEQGTIVPVNAPIAMVGSSDEKLEEGQPPKVDSVKQTVISAPAESHSTFSAPARDSVKATPLARKIARDNRVDLSVIKGSGINGRIVRKDVEASLSQPSPIQPSPAQSSNMTKLRQAIGRRLVESKTTIPHFYVTREFKMDSLMDMRKQINSYLPDNEKISVNDFIVKAVALSLKEFPNLNASLSADKIIQHGQINVGVAVTVEGGLLTVVVKDTDAKSLRQIASEVKAMAARARAGKVKPDDVDGSTFSTSNLGMYDVENFTAIINPPEAAILAIGSAREVAVIENGQLKAGWRMKATVSVDHRISDGAEAAQFMGALAKYLEEPLRMMA